MSSSTIPTEAKSKLAVSPQVRKRYGFTITRPVALLMVFFAAIVFGAFSLRLLPVNLMPDISYPRLTVRTEYPGAAPAEVENNVSRPLEEILGVVTGLRRISSISRGGYSDVVLEFSWSTDMDDANQDVLEKLDAVKSQLPEEIKQPLILRYDPTLDPVLTLSLSGEGEDFTGTSGLKYLRRIADRDIRRILEPIEGVAAVKVKGGLEEEIQVLLDEQEIQRTGVAISKVISRLQAENINLAGGSTKDGKTRYLVRTVNEFRSLDDILDLIIESRDGRDIKLRHIAEVSSNYKDRDVITRVDGREAVEIEVYKEADANIVDMASRVSNVVDQSLSARIKKEYAAKLELLSDRSLFIESSIDEVRNSALMGGLLSIVILFLFLRNVKSTVIVALAIPVSVVITFAPLKLAGVSLNIMSLGGLALGIGMLVDNSIVVLESIHRCQEEGDNLIQATLRGTSEVGSAVIASTLTTVAVFFPMVFVEGIAGQMFGDLGLTVVFSLLASLAVALFLIPMLVSRQGFGRDGSEQSIARALKTTWTDWPAVRELVRDVRSLRLWLLLLVPLIYVLFRFLLQLWVNLLGKIVTTLFVFFLTPLLRGGRLLRFVFGKIFSPFLWLFDRLIQVLERIYPKVIRTCLRHRLELYVVVFAGLIATGWAVQRLDSELIPELHQGEFTVEMSLPVGTPLQATDQTVKPLETELLTQTPHIRNLVTTIGSERDSTESGERGEHTSRLRFALTTQKQRVQKTPLSPMTSEPKEPSSAQAESTGQNETKKEEPAPGVDSRLAEAEALDLIRPLFARVPDATVHIRRPTLFSFTQPIEVEVRGYDLDDLALATNLLAEKLKTIEELSDVKSSILPGSPEIQIVYDRDALARYGLEIRQVAELVRDQVQGYEATKFNRKDRKIPVLVRLKDIREASIDELRNLIINPGQARPVPLSAVASLTLGRGPNEIRRIGQRRVGLVTANIEGAGLGSAVQRIEEELSSIQGLPEEIQWAVTGQSEEWETSSNSLYLALGLSIFLVYVIMASQFESLVYPLIILVSIPLAGIGVVFTLLILNIPVSVLVFLGAILLAGIVVNNAIVLVDYVNQYKARGYATHEALELAGKIRLRPILMTTLTTVLGLLPMALGMGDGAEIRMPMAVTVIAGLVFSTVLTLVVIPTIYAGVDRLFAGRKKPQRVEELATEIAAITQDQLIPDIKIASETSAPKTS